MTAADLRTGTVPHHPSSELALDVPFFKSAGRRSWPILQEQATCVFGSHRATRALGIWYGNLDMLKLRNAPSSLPRMCIDRAHGASRLSFISYCNSGLALSLVIAASRNLPSGARLSAPEKGWYHILASLSTVSLSPKNRSRCWVTEALEPAPLLPMVPIGPQR